MGRCLFDVKFKDGVYIYPSVITSKTITANGTYNANADDADGYNPIVVDIPYEEMIEEAVAEATLPLAKLIDRSIESLEIPYGTTKIGFAAFSNCTRLTSVTIPNTVTIIDANAFASDYSIKSLVIPKSVVAINSSAFSYMQRCALFDFSNHETIPTLSNSNVFVGAFDNTSANPNPKILVPEGLYMAWKNSTNWTSWRNYLVSQGEIHGDVTSGDGIEVPLEKVWLPESYETLWSGTTPFKAYYTLNGGEAQEITETNRIFATIKFFYQYYEDSGEHYYGFSIADGYQTGYISATGTYDIWVEDGNGNKVYRRILEVSE